MKRNRMDVGLAKEKVIGDRAKARAWERGRWGRPGECRATFVCSIPPGKPRLPTIHLVAPLLWKYICWHQFFYDVFFCSNSNKLYAASSRDWVIHLPAASRVYMQLLKRDNSVHVVIPVFINNIPIQGILWFQCLHSDVKWHSRKVSVNMFTLTNAAERACEAWMLKCPISCLVMLLKSMSVRMHQ